LAALLGTHAISSAEEIEDDNSQSESIDYGDDKPPSTPETTFQLIMPRRASYNRDASTRRKPPQCKVRRHVPGDVPPQQLPPPRQPEPDKTRPHRPWDPKLR
jgi:hypothetical protein